MVESGANAASQYITSADVQAVFNKEENNERN